MKRGRTERETCDLNGWTVGTKVRGHEEWSDGRGVWTTWLITAMGESEVLARTVGSERTKNGEVGGMYRDNSREGLVTFRHREWSEVAP